MFTLRFLATVWVQEVVPADSVKRAPLPAEMPFATGQTKHSQLDCDTHFCRFFYTSITRGFKDAATSND